MVSPELAGTLALLGLSAAPCLAQAQAEGQLPVERLEGDVHITGRTDWRGAHYQIRGHLFLDPGGELVAEDCTIELLCTYTRQFNFLWRGGKLVTRNCTIGGSTNEGGVCSCNFELSHGEWDATDTTVRYSSGIVFGLEHDCGLRATRLQSGPSPDSIIMAGRARAVVTDSDFAISLAAYADRGGSAVLDLPVDAPINQVYDARNLPGAEYRLELVNTTVPLWFLFVHRASMDGPATEIALRDCPRVIPSVLGGDLRGPVSLPTPWPGDHRDAAVRIGNVTFRALEGPTFVWCWGLYLWGEGTDLLVQGKTMICELMVWGGKVTLQGTPGAYETATSATTVEVGQTGGPPAELVLRNASIGRFPPGGDTQGQVTAHGSARVLIEDSRLSDLRLITRDEGTVALRGIHPEGALTYLPGGGEITRDGVPVPRSTP